MIYINFVLTFNNHSQSSVHISVQDYASRRLEQTTMDSLTKILFVMAHFLSRQMIAQRGRVWHYTSSYWLCSGVAETCIVSQLLSEGFS
jgi:type VI protein secretion system component VasK